MLHQQIYTFLSVAECGSFSKAAQKFFTTPASIMNQINQLENRVGVKLFERTNRGIILTSEGQLFQQESARLVEETENFIKKLRAGKNPHTKKILKIGTSILNPCKVFFDFWYSFPHEENYQFKIVNFDDDSTNILNFLDNLGKNIDFFVGAYDAKSWRNRSNFFQLGNYFLCIAVSKKHSLAKKSVVSLEDLAHETIMMTKPSDTDYLDKLRARLEKTFPTIKFVDTPFFYDIEVFNSCSESGNILLTLDAWQDVHPELVTIPLDEKISTPYGIVYSKTPSANMKDFISFFETNFQSSTLIKNSSR